MIVVSYGHVPSILPSIRNLLFLMNLLVTKEEVGNLFSLIVVVKIYLILACILVLVLDLYQSLWFGIYSILGITIAT